MVSTLNGPFPPYSCCGNGESYIDRPGGRNRPEASQYAAHGKSGTVGMLFEVAGTACTSRPASTTRFKPEPQDHVAENVKRIRRIQRENKKRVEESRKPMKAMWKSSKYECVESRVKEQIKKENGNPSRPQSANYLRAHSRTGWSPLQNRPLSTEPPVHKMTVPKADSAREVNIVRRNIDFVKTNGSAAKHTNIKRSPSLTMLDDLKRRQEESEKKYTRGEVPPYLINRQMQWHQDLEERRRNTPDPDMPPGHRVMPKDEQLQTLRKLKESQNELMRQISCLPIRSDTVTIRKKKAELDQKVTEVEEAIKIFSRPKVFIKLDN